MISEVAFLWDESFLWGLIAYDALIANNLPFELLRAKDIKRGVLRDYKMLFVPGGWASNKLKALGKEGIKEIRDFVRNGGNYLGICGGAGLATLDGIGLLDVKRVPRDKRVPSFNGRIGLYLNEHPIWNSLVDQVFYIWWPSQFLLSNRSIGILATYDKALPDSFSSDLNVGDVEQHGNWAELEDLYRINLNPERLMGEPAVIEGRFGNGKVILSMVHFDTPYDKNGSLVLRNLWEYLGGKHSSQAISLGEGNLQSALSPVIKEIESLTEELIDLGMRNFLWFWRHPVLLQWKRGVRGLEYCTLYRMVKEFSKLSNRLTAVDIEMLKVIRGLLIPFVDKAKRLLMKERIAMQKGPITYERCDDPEIQSLRRELFGDSKSHGGIFKEILDRIDDLLYRLLKDATMVALDIEEHPLNRIEK